MARLRSIKAAELFAVLCVLTVNVVRSQINVEYPEGISNRNYSYVKLSCGDGVLPVQFKLNDTTITDIIEHVVIETENQNEIEFTFTQDQEGVFSCLHNGVTASVTLAATPRYDDRSMSRYFIIQSDSERVEVLCAIQPGALASKYSVEWMRILPDSSTQFLSDITFNITRSISPLNPQTYQCRVTIKHKTLSDGIVQDQYTWTYNGPSMTINTQVLSTLSENAISGDHTVNLGDTANLYCQVTEGNTAFSIFWTIKEQSIKCDDEEVGSNITCVMINSTFSILQIEDTIMIGAGTHNVQCILQPNIEENYISDPSFTEEFSENMTKNVTLTVIATIEPSRPPSLSIQTTLAILGPLVVVTVIAALLVVLLLIWRIIKSQHKNKSSTNQDRELPEIPSNSPQLSYIEQLKEELGGKNMLFQKNDLKLTKVIGEGESGLVYLGHLHGNKYVAVKAGKALISENQKENLLKEVSLMMSFEHPNVMPLVGMCFDGEVPLLITPFMSDGSVLDYVRNNEEMLNCPETSSQSQILTARKKCMDMCHQIAKGMSYLAMKRFVHRDLAARNCMIDGLANGVIKVADFGMTEDMYATSYCNYDSKMRGERVPLKWMAPESIEKNRFSESSDVWSYGVTCWEVFTCGRIPYSGVPVMTLLSELHSGQRLDRPTNIACSDSMWALIKTCWSVNPEGRPTFNDIVRGTADLLDCDSSYIKL